MRAADLYTESIGSTCFSTYCFSCYTYDAYQIVIQNLSQCVYFFNKILQYFTFLFILVSFTSTYVNINCGCCGTMGDLSLSSQTFRTYFIITYPTSPFCVSNIFSNIAISMNNTIIQTSMPITMINSNSNSLSIKNYSTTTITESLITNSNMRFSSCNDIKSAISKNLYCISYLFVLFIK